MLRRFIGRFFSSCARFGVAAVLSVWASASPGADPRHATAAAAASVATAPTKTCGGRGDGMPRVDVAEAYGEICRPSGDTLSARVLACLSRGLEAVMVPDYDGVLCAAASRGRFFLDAAAQKREGGAPYALAALARPQELCATDRPVPDKRLVPRSFVKELVRKSGGDIDPRGVRIIGGVFCEGLELSGAELPFSLVLDKSLFTCASSTECARSPVDIRNFRTKGDLSFDYAASHVSIRITRSDIAGSLYGQGAFFEKIYIGDSAVHGSVNAPDSFFLDEMTIENAKIAGGVDLSRSLFSHLVLIRNRIEGSLDLGQTRARCSFDVRQNDIDDFVAVEFGFGDVRLAPDGKDELFGLRDDDKTKVMMARFGGPAGAIFGSADTSPRTCAMIRSIVPGSFVFIGNHVRHSACLRAFGWLSDSQGRLDNSIIYLNEDIVDGATWLDLEGPAQGEKRLQHIDGPQLSIFNLKTGTYVMDFGGGAKNIVVSVNGLHFDRVYSARDKCENALTPRATREQARPRGGNMPSFPPRLSLPNPEAVTAWVKRNSFKGTQPFEEFVNVFEKAGDADAARELRIQGETASVMRSLCSAWGVYCEKETGGAVADREPEQSPVARFMQRIEARIVAILQLGLWRLADHGYRPERAVWFVIGTMLFYWLALQLVLGIVGFSLIDDKKEGEPPQIQPIGLIFLFDKLIPAYQLRADHSKPMRFYVLADDGQENAHEFRRFFRKWEVVEATEAQQRRMRFCLDTLRWLGLVFAIFIFAAIGRLVR